MSIGTAHGARSLYERRDGQRVTVHDIQQAKQQGERFVMLTAYDTLVAAIFDRVGVPLLLVGDTSGEVVFGYPNTVPVTMDHLVPLVQAVVRGTSHALVVGDLPFGAYQESAEAALAAGVRHLKEGGAQAVKLEGGRPVVPAGCPATSSATPISAGSWRWPRARSPRKCAPAPSPPTSTATTDRDHRAASTLRDTEMARVDYDQMAASYDRGRPVLDLGAGTGLFAFQTLQQVPQVSAPSLRAAVERVRQRADSTLEPLPDEQFAQGLAALERAAAAESARPR
jgi:hypothetical protein